MGLKLRRVFSATATECSQDAIVKTSLNLEAPGNNADEIDWLNYGNKLLRSLEAEAAQAFDTAIKIKQISMKLGMHARSADASRKVSRSN